MKTREHIQAEVACSMGDPVQVEGFGGATLQVYPPSVGLMMALRAMGNTLAISIDEPGTVEAVTQEDTLIFYWAVCQEPSVARRVLAQARATGDTSALLEAAEEFGWLLTPSVVAALNAAIARTREQVQAVTVQVIPDKDSPGETKN